MILGIETRIILFDSRQDELSDDLILDELNRSISRGNRNISHNPSFFLQTSFDPCSLSLPVNTYLTYIYTHIFHPGLYSALRNCTAGTLSGIREEKQGDGAESKPPDITCLIFFTPFHEYLGGFSRRNTCDGVECQPIHQRCG